MVIEISSAKISNKISEHVTQLVMNKQSTYMTEDTVIEGRFKQKAI